MRRDWTSRFLLLALLGVFGAFAWLTRHPDAPIVEIAEEWPLVGTVAAHFRARWLPPSRPPPPPVPAGDGQTIIVLEAGDEAIERRAALEIEARERVWVEEGVELKSAPARDAPLLVRTRAIANLPVLERRGDWYRLRLDRLEGWALLEDREEAGSPPLGSAPEPVLPLPGRSPDPELLEKGRTLLGLAGRTLAAEPYTLHTDSRDPQLEDFVRRLAAGIEGVYRKRYGLTPVGEAAETLILFSNEADFHSFRRFADDRIPGWVLGFFSKGVVATHAEGREPSAVAATFAHELTHVLNRRSLGPGLPPWLEEGLAEDVERIARVLHTGRPESTGHRGSPSAPLEAAGVGPIPELASLMSLDERDFHAAELRLIHRQLVGWWIRFLLDDEEIAGGFRRYLAEVARGEPLTPELLYANLALGAEDLEVRFRAWLAR